MPTPSDFYKFRFDRSNNVEQYDFIETKTNIDPDDLAENIDVAPKLVVNYRYVWIKTVAAADGSPNVATSYAVAQRISNEWPAAPISPDVRISAVDVVGAYGYVGGASIRFLGKQAPPMKLQEALDWIKDKPGQEWLKADGEVAIAWQLFVVRLARAR